jgi:4-diphosphocytidyl-2-C-methyl-D-erythritol kinase
MSTRVRSFCKINLGLAIGPPRPDGFHALTTMYQTLALHDLVTISAKTSENTIISLTSNHPGVPTDEKNTVWKMVAGALKLMGIAAEVEIHIQKNLPVQGGLGAGSANAAAALIGLERELNKELRSEERLSLAAKVGSDVPLFLLGGAVLGVNRGETVSFLPDLPETVCLVIVPAHGVSTPQAFRDWDARYIDGKNTEGKRTADGTGETASAGSDRLEELSRALALVFAESGTSGVFSPFSATPGVEVESLKDLAGDPLLALVRTGIENDFEKVVFPQYPSLRDIKRDLVGSDSGSPAIYAALSGSGSALFGLYTSVADAEAAQQRVLRSAPDAQAFVTKTLPRAAYWSSIFA